MLSRRNEHFASTENLIARRGWLRLGRKREFWLREVNHKKFLKACERQTAHQEDYLLWTSLLYTEIRFRSRNWGTRLCKLTFLLRMRYRYCTSREREQFYTENKYISPEVSSKRREDIKKCFDIFFPILLCILKWWKCFFLHFKCRNLSSPVYCRYISFIVNLKFTSQSKTDRMMIDIYNNIVKDERKY